MTDLQQALAWAENEAMRRPPAEVQHLRVLAGAVKLIQKLNMCACDNDGQGCMYEETIEEWKDNQ